MTQSTGRRTSPRRVALTPGTWATLSLLKKPGQTFDDTIAGLIADHQRLQLTTDLDAIDAREKTVSWNRAKKNPGLKRFP
jgi:hypothetical protein